MMKTSHGHPAPTQLKSGYTTGACAAAAAKGAALMLRDQRRHASAEIRLPNGDMARFRLHGQRFSAGLASCFVVKDAGDDPDITNGVEVWAAVQATPLASHGPAHDAGERIGISGGTGIGRVTKPGLAVPPGEWAINPVPRRMITEAVSEVFTHHSSRLTPHPSPFTLHVVISIPDGEERAKKTLNARLGIVGGLSILGTTGIVRPISAKAWTDTIDAALDVARACGCATVVLSTGRTSEVAAQKYFGSQGPGTWNPDKQNPFPVPPSQPPVLPLPEEAYIMMGDHVAYAMRACRLRGFLRPVIACQFAKLLKIACGHENTHAAASELDLATLMGWTVEAGISQEIVTMISQANTARELVIASGFDPALIALVSRHARLAAERHAAGIAVQFLLADYNGNCIAPPALDTP